MMKKVMKTLLALAMAFVCGGAWAANPVAVWENLNISGDALTQNGMTLNLNLGDGDGKNHVVGTAVQIGDKPITVTLGTDGFTDYMGTVIVKYSGVSANPTALTSLVSFDGSNGNNYTGLVVDTNGAVKGIWSQGKWNDNTDGNFKADGEAHRLTFAVEMTKTQIKKRGTHGYIDNTVVYNRGGLVGSETIIKKFNIGGVDTGSSLPVYSGLVIEKIAVFNDVLTSEEANAFVFPSDVFAASTHIATITGENISWGDAGAPTDWATAKVVVTGSGRAEMDIAASPASLYVDFGATVVVNNPTVFPAYDGGGIMEFVFDCTTQGKTADNTLKTYIRNAPHTAKFVFKGSGSNGMTIDYGATQETTIAAIFSNHIIFDGGTHSLKYVKENGGSKFGAKATQDNPTIRVTGDATLTFTGKNWCGWASNAVDANGIIRVDNGSTLNASTDDVGTFYWAQQFYLEPGATANFRSNNKDVRFNGGIKESAPQIYVPAGLGANAGKTATVNLTNSSNLEIRGEGNGGSAFFVGENATLTINGNITGNQNLTKYGVGTLKVTGSIPNTGTKTIAAGYLAVPSAAMSGNLTIQTGASLAFASDSTADTTYSLCTGTLTTTSATKENVGIYVGSTPIVANLTFDADAKTVSYAKVRDIGDIYYVSGNWNADTQYATTAGGTATTKLYDGDVINFTSDKAVYQAKDWHQVVDIKVADGVTATFGHDAFNKNDGHPNNENDRNIESGSTITLGTESKALFTFWGPTASAGYAEIKDLVINGVNGSWGIADSQVSGLRIYGKVTGTAPLMIGEGHSILLCDGGSISNPIKSSVATKAVGFNPSTNIYSLVDPIAKIGDANYATLSAAIEAAGAAKTTITMVAASNESVSIPSNVTIALTANTQKLTGTITGTGTIKLTQSATSNTADLLSWINQADTMNDFAGTIHLNAGRFELKAADVTHLAKAKFKVTDGAQAFLGGGTWNNAFTISGNGYGGETDNIGCAAIRIHDGVLGENATVTSEDANATIGVNNGQKTVPCAITVSENNAINFYTRYTTDTITVSGVISGAGSVKKNGPGKLTLSGVNTFTGGLEIANGQVNAGIAASDSGSAFGALQDGSWVTVRSGATLDLNGQASLDNNGYRIKSAGTIRSSADMDANSKCIGALELIGNTTVEGTYFGMSVGQNNTATTIKMDDYTLTIHMDSGKNFNLRNTTITGGGIIEQTQGNILVFNTKATYDGTLKKNGGNIEIKEGLDLDVKNLEFGANPGTFSSTGCLVVRGKMSGAGTVACNLSLETNATIDASNGHVTATGSNMWFHNSHKIIANVGDTVITKTGYSDTMPSVTRIDAEGQTVDGEYYLNNNGGVITLGQYVARDTSGTLYKTIQDAIEGVGAENISTITVLVNDAEVPPGYRINNGTIEVYESIYSKWTDVPAMFTFSGNDGNFHKGHYIKFDLSKEAEATPKVDINGNGSVAANTLPEWKTALSYGWYLFCSSSNFNSYGPGYALRFAGTEGAGAKDASFNDLTFGGMIVEEGAVGWSITNNGGVRTTYLGDGRVGDEAVETWFVYNENFEFNRGPLSLRGEINIDIANGKTLSLNTANGNGNAVTVDAKTVANVKFHGAGSLAVKTLNATGMVTLDYTDVACDSSAFINGTLAVDGRTTIKLPAGAEVGSSYELATTISGAFDDANILVGGVDMSDTIHWTISGGTITADEAISFATVDGVEFKSLTKAIAAASEGQNKTVTLLRDIDGGNRIVPSGVVVDTNGHSISGVIILRNGAYILEGTGENKKAKIDGISTSFDATFDDPAHPTDLKYKRYTNVTLQYDGGDKTWMNVNDGKNTTTGVCLNRHPYLNYIANTTWFQDTDDLTIAVAGVMPNANSTIFVHMGSTNSGSQNGLFIATGTNDTQVVVGYNNGTKAYLIDDMIVPNARQCRHSYVVTKHDTRDPEHPEADPVTTTFTIYLDGLKWKSKTFNWFQITGGFQVGKAFGAAMAAGNAEQKTITATGVAGDETTSYVNYLRAYDRVISQAEISRYAEVYEYTSPNGTYTRDISANGNWVLENAWVERDSSASKPASDGNVVLTATHSEGDEALAKTITINLEDAVEYEKLTLKGDSMIFQRENQTAKPIKSICTVISTSVTLKEGAIDLTAGPTIIAEGGKLIFDFSSLTEAEVAAHPLSEKVTGDIEQDENINDPTLAKITVLKPSDVHINVRLEYIDGSYWVKADGVGFKCQVVGDENGAWDFSNTPIVWEGENVDLKTGDNTYTRTMGSMPSSKGFSYTLGDKHNNMVITMLVDLKATDTDKMLVSVGYAKTAGTPSNYVNLLYTSDEQLMMTHGEKGTTGDSKFSTSVVTGKHLIEVSFPEAGGVKLKLDGVQVASDSSIKWTGGGNQVPCGIIRFGSHADTSKTYVANGTVYYSIDIDCTKSNSIENPTAQFEVPAVFAGSENADKAQLIMEFLNADGQVVIPGAYKVDGGAVITNPAEIRELASLIGNNDCSSAVNFAMPFVPAEQTTDANTVKIAINLSHDVTGNVTLCVGTSPDGANTVVDTKSNPSSGVQTFTLDSISSHMGEGKVLYFKVKATPAQAQ